MFGLKYILSKIAPWHKFEVSTAMSKDTVLKTIANNIGSPLTGARFYGKVDNDSFKIRPYIYVRGFAICIAEESRTHKV